MSLLAPLAFLAALAPGSISGQSGAALGSALLTLLAPQENGSEQYPSKLTPAEQKKLADSASNYFAAMSKAEETKRDDKASTQQVERASADQRKMKDAFEKEFAAKDQKLALLAQLGDLQAIFANAFPYKSEPGNGEYREVTPAKEERAATYGIVIPKTYKVDHAIRTVIVIPGHDDERKRFVPAKDWFDSTWKGSELTKDTVFVIPRLDQKVATSAEHSELLEDFDPEPDLSKPASEAEEETRNTAILRPMLQTLLRLNLDRERMLLDAGKGACGYALRLATYFPNRFAGLILRHPVDPGKTRLESLTGVPVLIVVKKGESAERKAADQIAGILNGFKADSCKVIEGSGEHPFTQSAGEIGTWASTVKRDLFRKKVVLVPNHHHPRFQSGYWVKINQSDMLGQVADKDRPAVIAEADRAANRITVTATGVSHLTLFLNDALVDLGKDVTIVVNGNAETRKVVRELNLLTQMIKGTMDPGFLWVARHEASVKK